MKKLIFGLVVVVALVVSLVFMVKHLKATEQMYGGSYEECIAQELGDQATCERVFTYQEVVIMTERTQNVLFALGISVIFKTVLELIVLAL